MCVSSSSSCVTLRGKQPGPKTTRQISPSPPSNQQENLRTSATKQNTADSNTYTNGRSRDRTSSRLISPSEQVMPCPRLFVLPVCFLRFLCVRICLFNRMHGLLIVGRCPQTFKATLLTSLLSAYQSTLGLPVVPRPHCRLNTTGKQYPL